MVRVEKERERQRQREGRGGKRVCRAGCAHGAEGGEGRLVDEPLRWVVGRVRPVERDFEKPRGLQCHKTETETTYVNVGFLSV